MLVYLPIDKSIKKGIIWGVIQVCYDNKLYVISTKFTKKYLLKFGIYIQRL